MKVSNNKRENRNVSNTATSCQISKNSLFTFLPTSNLINQIRKNWSQNNTWDQTQLAVLIPWWLFRKKKRNFLSVLTLMNKEDTYLTKRVWGWKKSKNSCQSSLQQSSFINIKKRYYFWLLFTKLTHLQIDELLISQSLWERKKLRFFLNGYLKIGKWYKNCYCLSAPFLHLASWLVAFK